MKQDATTFDGNIEAQLDRFEEAVAPQPTAAHTERAREIAELSPNECGACGGQYPNPECGHLKNANYLATQAPCKPMTEGFVEAISAALTGAERAGFKD